MKPGLKGALLRYRVMAFWSGCMSLLLWFVEVPENHILHHYSGAQVKWVWIAIVHGFTYPIYVVTAFHYSLKARKSFMTTIFYILAGTLPIASFVAERRATRDFNNSGD
jgi:integral membrane protein